MTNVVSLFSDPRRRPRSAAEAERMRCNNCPHLPADHNWDDGVFTCVGALRPGATGRTYEPRGWA